MPKDEDFIGFVNERGLLFYNLFTLDLHWYPIIRSYISLNYLGVFCVFICFKFILLVFIFNKLEFFILFYCFQFMCFFCGSCPVYVEGSSWFCIYQWKFFIFFLLLVRGDNFVFIFSRSKNMIAHTLISYEVKIDK